MYPKVNMYALIFTMVSYLLNWSLLKFLSLIPNNHCQIEVLQLGESHAQW